MSRCRRAAGPLAAALALAVLAPAACAQKKADRPVFKFRIYWSLTAGLSESNVRGVSQPMLDLIDRRVGQPFECDVCKGSTPEDLFAFGKKLNDGEYHIAAVMGIEYGWLAQKYPNLKPLAVIFAGDRTATARTQLYVKRGREAQGLAALKGGKLATYKGMPFMDELFLREMLVEEKQEPKGFFLREKVPHETVREAVTAVIEGQSDCVVLNDTTYYRLQAARPGMAKALRALKHGDPYPMPVLVGSPAVVDRLRREPGLWRDIRQELLTIHTTPEGEECVRFWRFTSFVAPDEAYEKHVKATAEKFPVKALLTLE